MPGLLTRGPAVHAENRGDQPDPDMAHGWINPGSKPPDQLALGAVVMDVAAELADVGTAEGQVAGDGKVEPGSRLR